MYSLICVEATGCEALSAVYARIKCFGTCDGQFRIIESNLTTWRYGEANPSRPAHGALVFASNAHAA